MRGAQARDSEHGRRQAERARPEARVPEHEDAVREVLSLQRSAGNRAVGSLLAREPDTAEKADKGGKAEGGGATSTTLVCPDPIGVLPVDSFSFDGSTTITLTVPSTDKDPVIFQYGADGKTLGTVTLSSRGFNVVLGDAVITSVRMGQGGVIQFSVSGASVEVADPNAPKPGEPDRPGGPP